MTATSHKNSGRSKTAAAKSAAGRQSPFASGGRARQRGRRRLWRVALAAVLLLATGGGALFYSIVLGAPGNGERATTFEVRPGVGALRVARDLADTGMIDDAETFRLYLRVTGLSQKLKAGVYDLNDGMSVGEIADILTQGRVQLTALTIPEGWTNRQIGDYLTERGFVENREAFLKLAADPRTLEKWGIPDRSTEGYLFPETYMVARGASPQVVHDAMLTNFFRVLEEVSGSRTVTADVRQRIVLASIVEREAVRAQERPMMAQVFLNRLDQNMRLESCATIQYLFDRPKPRIYDRDLEIESPYNTYRNRGLPPGPISNPGRAAIEAAFRPRAGDYLFFVLKPDGSHHFSKTYGEHLNAKKKYIGP